VSTLNPALDDHHRARRRPVASARHGAAAVQSAAAVLTPLLDGPRRDQVWVAAAFLLGAIACDTLGNPQAAERALQHALDLAGPDQMLSPFFSHPSRGVPERHDRYPSADGTLTGPTAGPPSGADRLASLARTPARHLEALTHGETRVLAYLPTNLSAREIAGELYLSVNTVKTHQRHLYQKLGARSRTQAVEQARALGLIAPSSRRR
jgi:LuxR family maltose regulon positive regulatory protein